MGVLNVVTLNAKGLNVPEKRRMLLNEMRHMKADIVLIQETHFREDKFPILKNRYYPTAYHSTHIAAKSRGVSIQISASIPWTLVDKKSDQAGRFLFIKGMIGSTKVTIANFYAPNEHQDTFMKRHLKTLQNFSEGQLIVGGDLNIPLIPAEDTSTGSSSVTRGTLREMSLALHTAQLIDTWRLFHPGERDYTFFSRPHQVYSRIDFLLVPHNQLRAIKHTAIGSITWSDHAPVSMQYDLSDYFKSQRKPWRLNESLLQDPAIVADVSKEISHYFHTNTIEESDFGLTWEAHKAVIRGVLIKHGSRVKKQKSAQLASLFDKLHKLESAHKTTPSRPLGSELDTIRMQITDLLQFKAKAALQISRKKIYESGNKCGRLLAQSLKTQNTASYIPHINSSTGRRAALPQQITQEFRSYYENLYNLNMTQPSPEKIAEYLANSKLPSLSTETRDILDEPITLTDIQLAIKNTKQGKAPGPDGLTLQYYKTLLPSLGQYLTKLFNDLGKGKPLHKDTLQAQITVIHKEDKDPTQCGSYRPISLLNTDLKLFTKILATRLQQHITSLIHLDQVGFVPTREARDNTTKVLNLLYHATKTATPTVLLSTDAEKAFDRVNWSFMLSTLKHIGLGDSMVNWISAVYATPTARVRVNGVMSEAFQISNGTRQGCPLSPLLFALTLEPFLCHIRLNPDITGLILDNTQYKISAYADDLMFSLTNPMISLPNLLKEFSEYGSLAYLKINWAKSEAMSVGIPDSTLKPLKASFKLKWTDKALKYLGTFIPQTMTKLYEVNFPPLITKIKTLLNSWQSGFHSWVGRGNILKMSILPKILYIMQAVPIRIPPGFFKQIQTIFTEFIWAKKKPRLPHKLLVLPKSHGGLAIPDIRAYHQAIHLGRLIDWRRHRETKLWTHLEQSHTLIPLGGTPWCYSSLPRELKQHPLIGNTARICAKLISKPHISSRNSPLVPIIGHPLFTPGLQDRVFRVLGESGIHSAIHFSTGGAWKTYTELSNPQGLFRLDFMRTLQLGHFLHSITPPADVDQGLTTLEEICSNTGTLPHTISLMYSLLITPPSDYIPPGLTKWEEELGCSFNLTQRQRILRFTHKSSICAKTQETNYKILSRWYRTPTLLHKISPTISEECWRCQRDKGTLLHIFWSCPKLSRFWKVVHETIQLFTDRIIPKDPALFLLHATDIPDKVYKRSVIRHLLDAARACIPLCWKLTTPPPIDMWLCKVEDIKHMEDLIHTAQHREEAFSKTWQLWTMFIYSAAGQSLRVADESR